MLLIIRRLVSFKSYIHTYVHTLQTSLKTPNTPPRALHGFTASPIEFISHERKQVVIQFLNLPVFAWELSNLGRYFLRLLYILNNYILFNNAPFNRWNTEFCLQCLNYVFVQMYVYHSTYHPWKQRYKIVKCTSVIQISTHKGANSHTVNVSKTLTYCYIDDLSNSDLDVHIYGLLSRSLKKIKTRINLQNINIPRKNCFVFVFVIYCVGVKLWTQINICIMSFVLFVIYMYAVQKREKIWKIQKNKIKK